MALWKIEIKQSGTINSVRIEKGMFVEIVTANSSAPPLSMMKNYEAIGQLFKAKYGVDLMKAHIIGPGRMSCTKIK
jgi:hypothetical protein